MNGIMAFGLETNAEGERARIIAGSPFLFFLCYCLRSVENRSRTGNTSKTVERGHFSLVGVSFCKPPTLKGFEAS